MCCVDENNGTAELRLEQGRSAQGTWAPQLTGALRRTQIPRLSSEWARGGCTRTWSLLSSPDATSSISSRLPPTSCRRQCRPAQWGLALTSQHSLSQLFVQLCHPETSAVCLSPAAEAGSGGATCRSSYSSDTGSPPTPMSLHRVSLILPLI